MTLFVRDWQDDRSVRSIFQDMKYVITPVTRFKQNCSMWICEQTRRAVVIDPGGDIERIIAVARENEATIEKLLITHGHMDHASAGGALAKKLGVPIEGPHQQEAFLFKEMPQQCLEFGMGPIEDFVPDRWLNHGDTVSFGNEQIEVLHCPGHTPGHVAYFHRGEKLAAVGDILFAGSVGVTRMHYGSHPQLVASIRQRLFPLGDRVRFIPGHGKMSSFGFEREFNPFVCDDLFD